MLAPVQRAANTGQGENPMSDKNPKPAPDKARDLARKPLTPASDEALPEGDLDKVSGGGVAPPTPGIPPRTYLCTNE
jgi:hypothetical protein